MEKIIKYFVIAITIGLISISFPQAISYDNPIQVFVSLLIIWFTEVVLIRIFILIGLIFYKGNIKIIFIYLWLVLVFVTPLALIVSRNFLIGLEINGVWTYIVLTILISIIKIVKHKD